MHIKYTVKSAFSSEYLSFAKDEDLLFKPNRVYSFKVCNAEHEVALFDTKEEAVEAFTKDFAEHHNETGVIVEMIVHE